MIQDQISEYWICNKVKLNGFSIIDNFLIYDYSTHSAMPISNKFTKSHDRIDLAIMLWCVAVVEQKTNDKITEEM